MLARAVRFHSAGGPEVLRLEQVEVGEPGPGEVRIRHAAIGCNFADTYFRSGYYPVQPPCGIGVEGAGTIEAVGEGVTGFAVGDRVAYNGSPLGAYSEARVMPAAPLFKLPDAISFETAAASTMRGLSATYWLLKTDPRLKAGDTILLHAAAGGVGLLAVQIAKLIGLRVIGTVSTEAKAEKARALGCDEIIFYRREDVAARVKELTGGEGVQTVFDSVGKDTFEGSLKSLRRRGMLVGCGTASGPFPPIDAFQTMLQGSVYFIRPAFADFFADPAERAELAKFWFDNLSAGRINLSFISDQYVGTVNDTNPQSLADGYAVLGARITLNGPEDRWSISAFGKNLANANYRPLSVYQPLGAALGLNNTVFSGSTANRVQANEPRTYGLSASVRF